MKTGKTATRTPIGGGGSGHISVGSGPMGGGGSGPIGGGIGSRTILKTLARQFREIAKTIDALSRTPIGGDSKKPDPLRPIGGDPKKPAPTKK
ncbi:MAG: hypothetical protein ABI759_00130 [Candidatus Solibacter sp.]